MDDFTNAYAIAIDYGEGDIDELFYTKFLTAVATFETYKNGMEKHGSEFPIERVTLYSIDYTQLISANRDAEEYNELL